MRNQKESIGQRHQAAPGHVQVVRLLITAVFMLSSGLAAGEGTTQFDDYTVHHSVLRTDFLEPEVASAYGVQRSKYQGLLTLSVLQERADEPATHVPARFDVTMVSGTRQRTDIAMRQAKEGEAIYYLGQFPIMSGQNHLFVIEFSPEGSQDTHTMRVEERFYTE